MKSEIILVPATGSDGDMDVIEISVSAGDEIDYDQTIVVLESDKATVEVPSPKSGKVEAVEVVVGDKVKEGDALIKLTFSEDELTDRSNKGVAEGEPSSDNESDTKKEDTLAISDASTLQQVVVPDLGGSEKIEVIEIIVSEGDLIDEDQTLIVLESDKATMEIPCPFAGSLVSIHIKVGDKVSAGDLIAELKVSTQNTKRVASVPQKEPTFEQVSSKSVTSEVPNTNLPSTGINLSENSLSTRLVHAGPAVRKFAREHGADLTKIKPSGPKDRVLVDDVSAYIKAQVQRAQSGVSSGLIGLSAPALPDFKQFGEITVLGMSKVHLKTAENMQRSWGVPHVTQFDEADITEMEKFRTSQKPIAESKGLKLTPIVFMLKACAYALKALPQFNVALDLTKQQLIQKHFIHIGFAVDTDHGLFVPVIRDVDRKGIWELAAECQDLAAKARDKKLQPADMQGGCFTISSLGALGGTAFTPIVNTPEVAILGVSKAQMKPVYNGNNDFEARLILPLSLSYDHRAVNGADGARFTTLLAKVMGDIRELLL